MNKKKARPRIETILSRLKKRYPDEMQTSLNHENPWELLVATMLSAQTQDAQVNKATPALFRKYPNIKSFVGLRPAQLYKYTKSLNIYRNKSKYVILAAQYIQRNFGGRVPQTMEKLVQLPGVGRKTANVVLANAFGKHEGIAIDTHCITVANRLFLYRAKSAMQVEEQLTKIVPKSDWGNVNHLFIALGRDVCTAKRKMCKECVLNDICLSSDVK